jgi:hypothetical protein
VTQVPVAEDEHPVGELGAGGEHEPFCTGIRTGTPRWDLDGSEASVGEYGVVLACSAFAASFTASARRRVSLRPSRPATPSWSGNWWRSRSSWATAMIIGGEPAS